MKIGIMGVGYVGTATKQVFEKHHQVIPYDPNIEEYKDIEPLKLAEVIFIIVPTPSKLSGEIDLQYIESAMMTISNLGTTPVVCIKSTIIPGTCDYLEEEYGLRISHNPEFLRERCAYEDFVNSDRVVIGGNKDVQKIIEEVYRPIFPDINYIFVSNKEAEMVKYMTNIFLSTQVSFANEMYNICNLVGINYDNVKEAIFQDKRLGRFIHVPGNDKRLGFGGSCLPKELKAMIYHAREKGYVPTLLQESWRFNQEQRK